MEHLHLYVVAGITSSLVFISSYFPMIYKAIQTRNLKSYSLTSLLLANLGNLVHWLYIVSLPFGPIWFLHSFYTFSSILMLLLYLRNRKGSTV